MSHAVSVHVAVITAVFFAAQPLLAADTPVEPQGQPHVPLWSASNQIGNSILNWDPTKDPDVPFNRASIPLAPRIAQPVNVNPHAHINQGRIFTLTAFSLPTNNYSQGAATLATYIPGFWHYIDTLVYWGGSASSGSILAPSAPVIDAGHRNGVRVLGNVFLPPVVYGGKLSEVQAFLQQDAAGHFPVADKMILAAHTFGYDGYFINQETEGGDEALAKKMEGFLAYFKATAPDLQIQWYDAMDIHGKVGWKGALTDLNAPFFSTMTDGKPTRVSDSMFIDFRWASHPKSIAISDNAAKALGRSPFDLFNGIETEDGYQSPVGEEVDYLFGSGGDHLSSLGVFGTADVMKRVTHESLQPFYQADSNFWVGQNNDPSNTDTKDPWKGLANYVPAYSVIKGDTFATNFNKGVGTSYMIDGVRLATGDWYNFSLQDLMPTYQWIIHSTGTKLSASFDHSDAYTGGTSLLFHGKLDALNDIRLYQTELAIASDSKLKIAFKSLQTEVPFQIALAFADAPEKWQYLDATSTSPADAWRTATIDLAPYAGKTLISLGLRIGAPAMKSTDYQLHLGQLVLYRNHQSTPPAPTDLSIENTKNFATVSGSTAPVTLRVHWTAATSPAYTYNLYRRNPDHSLAFLGSTPATAYFVSAVNRIANETSVDLEIETVAPDFGVSHTRATLSIPVGWPTTTH